MYVAADEDVQHCRERCFVVKQKTAYEMRISDWSSDVCSSDLHQHLADVGVLISAAADSRKATAEEAAAACAERQVRFAGIAFGQPLPQIGRASWRVRGCKSE